MIDSATGTPEHFHAVQFYDDSKALCGIVADFLTEGLRRSHPALIIAVPEHTRLIEERLAAHGFDVATLKRDGDITTLDAHEALAMFMANGQPDPRVFRESIGAFIKQICVHHPNCTVYAFGEMVNILWRDGAEEAAIRLETLWNQLANSREFKLLCGYAVGNFYKGASIERIKEQHTHLTSESGTHAPLN